MAAPISVIIPTLNAEAALPGCLLVLMEGLDAGLIKEVIIADGGSVDATGAIAQAWGAETVVTEASRGGQLRHGCRAARGEWFLILHADTRMQAGWTTAVEQALRRPENAYWFSLRFDASGLAARIVAGWANLRSRVFGLPYGDQGLLVHRALYEATGGFPDQPLMEDVALARALKRRLVGLDAVAVTSAEKYRQHGWARRGARNLWTLLRYFSGSSPETLARSYRR